MFGTTPFPWPLHPPFSLESRYRCATKQRDEGSCSKTRHGLARAGANQSMGSRFSERLPTSTRLHRLRKRVCGWWMAPMGACMAESYTQICAYLTLPYLLLLRPLRFNALLNSCTHVPTLPTYIRTHAPELLTSVLFLGATA